MTHSLLAPPRLCSILSVLFHHFPRQVIPLYKYNRQAFPLHHKILIILLLGKLKKMYPSLTENWTSTMKSNTMSVCETISASGAIAPQSSPRDSFRKTIKTGRKNAKDNRWTIFNGQQRYKVNNSLSDSWLTTKGTRNHSVEILSDQTLRTSVPITKTDLVTDYRHTIRKSKRHILPIILFLFLLICVGGTVWLLVERETMNSKVSELKVKINLLENKKTKTELGLESLMVAAKSAEDEVSRCQNAQNSLKEEIKKLRTFLILKHS